MSRRFLAARISKLEQRRKPPKLVSHTVAEYRPDGTLIGPAIRGPHFRFINHGTDTEWQAALRAQQIKLIDAAYSEEMKRAMQ